MKPFLSPPASFWARRLITVMLGLSLAGFAQAADKKPAPPAHPAAPAATANATGHASFEDFALLKERNIFNPNRVGPTREDAEVTAPVGDRIALVGAMSNGPDAQFAFFDSPDSNYRQVLHEGGVIAQFKVIHITNEGVDLIRNDKPLFLKVGAELRRPVGGDWTVAAGETAPAADFTSPDAPAAAGAPAVPADASDVLKRMMERRQKQLKQ